MANQYTNLSKAIVPTIAARVRDAMPAQVRNFFFPLPDENQPQSFKITPNEWGGNPTKDLRRYVAPIPVRRIRTDIQIWRDALAEAESRILPFRYKMQRMFLDTKLKSQVIT